MWYNINSPIRSPCTIPRYTRCGHKLAISGNTCSRIGDKYDATASSDVWKASAGFPPRQSGRLITTSGGAKLDGSPSFCAVKMCLILYNSITLRAPNVNTLLLMKLLEIISRGSTPSTKSLKLIDVWT